MEAANKDITGFVSNAVTNSVTKLTETETKRLQYSGNSEQKAEEKTDSSQNKSRIQVLKANLKVREMELQNLIWLSWSYTVLSSQVLSENRQPTTSSEAAGFSSATNTDLFLNDEERAMITDSQLWNNMVSTIEFKLQQFSDAKALLEGE